MNLSRFFPYDFGVDVLLKLKILADFSFPFVLIGKIFDNIILSSSWKHISEKKFITLELSIRFSDQVTTRIAEDLYSLVGRNVFSRSTHKRNIEYGNNKSFRSFRPIQKSVSWKYMRDLRLETIYLLIGLRHVEFGRQNKKKVFISCSINNDIFVCSHILCEQLFSAKLTWIIIYMMKNMNMNMRINYNYEGSQSYSRQSVIS